MYPLGRLISSTWYTFESGNISDLWSVLWQVNSDRFILQIMMHTCTVMLVFMNTGKQTIKSRIVCQLKLQHHLFWTYSEHLPYWLQANGIKIYTVKSYFSSNSRSSATNLSLSWNNYRVYQIGLTETNYIFIKTNLLRFHFHVSTSLDITSHGSTMLSVPFE